MTSPKKSLKQDESWKVGEWLKCSQSPHYFLKTYGKIKDEEKGIIPWQDWGYLNELLDIFLKEKQVVILKARQLGISTLVCGYCLWRALFYEGSTIYLLSLKETTASKLLDKCKILWEYLPDFLRLKVGKWQESSLTFPVIHSSIDVLATTEDAGRSTGATIVILDEWERHDYDRQIFASIKPTIDSNNGQIIGLSTTEPTKSDTLFKEIYRKAQVGENNFYPLFLDCFQRPGRDAEWYKDKGKDLALYEMKTEYPRTEGEALSVIDIVNFFENDQLRQMLAECTLKPVEIRHNGLVKIYKPAIVGRRYFSGIDISDGRYDFTAMPIVDWQTNEVAVTFHAKIPADEAAYIIDEMGREYNNALLAPERNQPGLAVVNKLKDLEYPNLYYMDKNKPGWWTSGGATPHSRGALLHELRVPLSRREIVIYDPEIIKELMSFIQPKDDVPHAARGAHDDWVMAMAITWQMRKFVKSKFVSKSYKYRGF